MKMTKKRCPECGQTYTADFVFCQNDGADLLSLESPVNETPQISLTTAPATKEPAQPVAANEWEDTPSPDAASSDAAGKALHQTISVAADKVPDAQRTTVKGPAVKNRSLIWGTATAIVFVLGIGMFMAGNQSRRQAAEELRLAEEARNAAKADVVSAAQKSEADKEEIIQQERNATETKRVPKAASTVVPRATVLTPTAPQAWKGEMYPETRLRLLTPSEISSWSHDQTRYALNEMYARHGYDFQSSKIRQQFYQYEWYRRLRVPGRSQARAERLFNAIEAANHKLLVLHRAQSGR